MPETELVEDTQEVQEEPQENTEESTEETVEETVEEVQDNGASELWGEVVPELADEYSKLDGGTRENILLKRLQAKAQEAVVTAESSREAATNYQNPQPAAVSETSLPGTEAIQDAVQKAIDEGDSKALSTILNNQSTWMLAVAENLSNVVSGQDGRINDIVLPTRFQEVRDNVPGATDGDVREAMRLYKKGGFGDESTALKVAIFNRQTEVSSSQPKRTVDDEVRRKAKAMAASNMSNSGSPSGGVRQRLPETPEEIHEFMKRAQEGQ